jgi:GT2 family glycosyltransferase
VHIGRERAFETCWSGFPDRDIVILHPDMAPVPGQDPWGWYRGIADDRKKLPDAGMIACNLLFAQKDESNRYIVQCAGGKFEKGKIRHISKIPYPSGLDHVRAVPWVAFGGVLIRRRAIDCCGSFDRRYEWAYVMDVDFCLEARLRGFRLYQVLEILLHEENGTTKEFLKNKEYRKKMRRKYLSFYRKFHNTNEFQLLSVFPRDSGMDLSGDPKLEERDQEQ